MSPSRTCGSHFVAELFRKSWLSLRNTKSQMQLSLPATSFCHTYFADYMRCSSRRWQKQQTVAVDTVGDHTFFFFFASLCGLISLQQISCCTIHCHTNPHLQSMYHDRARFLEHMLLGQPGDINIQNACKVINAKHPTACREVNTFRGRGRNSTTKILWALVSNAVTLTLQ